MANPTMLRSIYEAAKQQRLMFMAAVVVGLALVLVAHAPVAGVVIGCALVMLIMFLRSWSRLKAKDPLRRGQ